MSVDFSVSRALSIFKAARFRRRGEQEERKPPSQAKRWSLYIVAQVRAALPNQRKPQRGYNTGQMSDPESL